MGEGTSERSIMESPSEVTEATRAEKRQTQFLGLPWNTCANAWTSCCPVGLFGTTLPLGIKRRMIFQYWKFW